MGQPALELHIYLSPSLGPCSLPSETPKSQVGSLLTCLSLSRRASESSLSSESSESSDAGEAQGCQGSLGGYLSLPTSLLIRLTSSPQPDGTPAASPCSLLVGHTTPSMDWLSKAGAGWVPPREMRSYYLKLGAEVLNHSPTWKAIRLKVCHFITFTCLQL